MDKLTDKRRYPKQLDLIQMIQLDNHRLELDIWLPKGKRQKLDRYNFLQLPATVRN